MIPLILLLVSKKMNGQPGHDTSSRIREQNQEMRFRQLENRIAQLEKKLELLLPGSNQTTIEGPCIVCNKTWLAIMIDRGHAMAIRPPNYVPLQGENYVQAPYSLNLHCKCSDICNFCIRHCGLGEHDVCFNHYNDNTGTCHFCERSGEAEAEK